MIYQNFEQILAKVRENPVKRRAAIAGAADLHVLTAVLEAQRRGIILPVLIGDPVEIDRLLKEIGSEEPYEIETALDAGACGEAAVRLIKEGKADFIMKGMIDTKDILRPLVKKENGLHLGRTMSHMAFDEIPGMSRLTVLTDGGMVPYPSLEEKRDIIINAVSVLRSLGYERPSVAVLCATEKVDPRLIETRDAEALAEMNRNGILKDCDVVGPISYDIAMNAEIAKEKKFDCPFCGQFDILLVPSMVAGNLLNKGLTVTGGAIMAGIVTGAKIPVAVASRGATVQEKFLSLALAALIV